MDNTREKIYLAALLHDIGKFYQRASGSINSEDNNLSKQSKRIRDYICPVKKETKEFSHQHVIWTNEFFEQNQKIFGSIEINDEKPFYINPWDENNLKEDNIANLASNHHRPYSELQKLIAIADRWSAGIDRKGSNEDKKDIDKHGLKFNSFKEIPLFSVFNILKIGKEGVKGNLNIAHRLESLELKRDTIFPEEIKQEEIRSLQEQYAELWKDFLEEFEQLPKDSYEGFEESLLYLLKKYTWAIPSNTMDMANVSLFDHLKTTAAIADSLYVAKNDEQWEEAFELSGDYPKVKRGNYPLLLLGADISGIQNFIFDIASSKAAKSLKGRSFYLQLLTEAIIMKFKKHDVIQSKAAHILYASGGKFYMVLPNTGKVKDAINKIKKDIEQELWDEHKGKISVNIAHIGFAHHSAKRDNKWISWIELEGEGEKEYKLKDLWKSLADKITLQKEQKFKQLITGKYDEFFNENDQKLKVGGKSKTCIVKGDEFFNNEKIYYLDEDKEKPVKKIVYEQTDLGTALKDADYLIVFKGNQEDDTYLNNRAKAKISVLDTNFYLFDDLELIDDEAEFRRITSADVSGVYMINRLNFLAAPIKGQKISYGFKFYGGNKQALIKDGKEKTFEDLAKTNTGENTLLGILRMDVDNLGKLFIQGFDEDSMSFSAYSTLSFNLDLFFSGYLNKLRDEYIERDQNGKERFQDDMPVYQFRDWVNILYSGGDDLFIVGRWDKVIEFAELIKNEFAGFTKRNEIGISGGMAFVHEKFPVSKAAQMAGEAESASKNYHKDDPFNNKRKNAITFFGETVGWEDEFMEVKELKEKLVQYISKETKPLSKAILHKLILYSGIKDKHLTFDKNKQDKKKDYSFLWHTAYYFKRYAEKYDPKKNNEEKDIIDFLNELKDNLFSSGQNNYRYYELAALAARWAEMKLKDYKKDRKRDEN